MNSKILIGLTLVALVWASLANTSTSAQTCDSCGKECQSACGTRGFRTCCLNYLKKRSEQPVPGDPEIRLPLFRFFSNSGQHFLAAKNGFLPETRDESSRAKIFIEKSPADKLKCFDYD